MITYLLRRVFSFFITFFIASLLVFGITRLLPGDVPSVILGRQASAEAKAALREQLGLDQPIFTQYTAWLSMFVRGDWGESYSLRNPIQPAVMQRLGRSLQLAAVALIFAVPPALLLGILAGLNENKMIDGVISVVTLILVGLPEFITGIILINIFSFGLKWLPSVSSVSPEATFIEAFPSLILPAITAAAVLLAYIVRLTRAGVVTELKQNYVRTATLKGLSYARVIGVHVLRNALLPTVTVIAISLGWLIGGLVVIENVFAYPGLGRLLKFAIDGRDLPLIQSITMVIVVIFMVTNLLADIVYALLNPRIQLS